jgi:hypothetical protein
MVKSWPVASPVHGAHSCDALRMLMCPITVVKKPCSFVFLSCVSEICHRCGYQFLLFVTEEPCYLCV